MKNPQAKEESAFYFIENIDLTHSLNALEERMDSLNQGIYDNGGTSELIEFAINHIQNKATNHETILDIHKQLIFTGKKSKRTECATALFFIFLALAKIAKNENREIISWRAIAKAEYYLGLIEGLTDPFSKLCSERGKKARNQRTQNERNLEKRIEELLIEAQASYYIQTPFSLAAAVVDNLTTERDSGKISFTRSRDELIATIISRIIDN